MNASKKQKKYEMLTIRVGFVVLGQATSSEVDKRKL
jgi:hypothetical protein